MPSASQSIVVNVPPDHFFETITDFASYPEFIPETVGVEILKSSKKKSGRVSDVRFSIKVIKRVDYVLRLTEEPLERMSWELVEGDLFKKNSGSWELKSAGKNKTEATYTVDVAMNIFVPQAITNMLVGSNLPKMLGQMKARAEGTWDKSPARKKG